MERPGLTHIDEDRCDSLRWKAMYFETVWDPTIQRSNDRTFWCHRTHQCVGPDGKVADDFECNETRRCFKPL